MLLDRSFYARDATIVAKDLLGKVLTRKFHNKSLSGIITETEAYMGIFDKASHSYGGRKTARTQTMFGPPGFSYVYFIYGLYHCLNAVTGQDGDPQAVLIRSILPLTELDAMSMNRYGQPHDKISPSQKKNLSNGPSKLCKAMHITKTENGLDLLGDILFIEENPAPLGEFVIEESKRIGIDYAEEARDYLWRFLIKTKVHS